MSVRDGLERIFDAKDPCNRERTLWKLSLLTFAMLSSLRAWHKRALWDRRGEVGGSCTPSLPRYPPLATPTSLVYLFISLYFPIRLAAGQSASANLGGPLSLG